jgi:hypothetical protein
VTATRDEGARSAEPRVERYADVHRAEWDTFVEGSKNGTFLFLRGYMDYHRDRFADHSLLIREDQELVALLPANAVDHTLFSHQGLTYGGLLVAPRMTTPRLLAVFDATLAYARTTGFTSLEYKTIPHIYHGVPSEEDRYALFRHAATLSRRDVLSVVDMANRPALQQRRQRGAAKARRQGLVVHESDDWSGYWRLLTAHLLERFGVLPVHALDEILLLRGRFPANIRLFTVSDTEGVLGGAVIYESPRVAHVQYIAASARGLALGGLDLLFIHLLDQVFAHKRYFDFGISNEQQGHYLNHGLIEQKEGFGGRAVVHDFYRVAL